MDPRRWSRAGEVEEVEEEARGAGTRAAARVSLAASRVGTRRSVESRKRLRRRRRTVEEGEVGGGCVGDDVVWGGLGSRAVDGETEEGKGGQGTDGEVDETDRDEKVDVSGGEDRVVDSQGESVFLRAQRVARLRDELASWSDGFEQAKGRRPNFKDVQKTRIPWLIESFKEYVRLRNKLISETPKIRGEVGKLAKQTLRRRDRYPWESCDYPSTTTTTTKIKATTRKTTTPFRSLTLLGDRRGVHVVEV